jgi:uncharacterized protein with HEPN domain
MLHSNIELVKHFLDETNFILNAVHGKHLDEVVTEPVLSRAIIRSLEIIGEASAKIDPGFKNAYPHIEWKKMSGTRNRLIHNYFGADYDIVIDIIKNKLPTLQTAIGAIISAHEN